MPASCRRSIRIALAVSRFKEFQSLHREVDDLRDALETRKLVERAKGILQFKFNLTEEEKAILRTTLRVVATTGRAVVLQAEISKDGTIQNLQLISGHPMLAPAAIEAVKQWRYKPYLLNGEPVAVETQVVVNFSLSGS